MKSLSAILLAFSANFIFYLIFLTKSEITLSGFFAGFFANPLESILYLIPLLFTSVFLIIIAVFIKNRMNVYLAISLVLFLIFMDLFLTKKLYGSPNIDNYFLGYKGFLDVLYVVIISMIFRTSRNCFHQILN